ncbi:MAG: hypothetical protein IJJ33_08770 [Victivallales bacterium]|nr:hypothetical protein [Victivallales bacterium]
MATEETRKTIEVIAELPPNHQDAASEGDGRKRGMLTTPSLDDEAIAPRREGGWMRVLQLPLYIKYHFFGILQTGKVKTLS